MSQEPTPQPPESDDVRRALARLDERMLDRIRAARDRGGPSAPTSLRELHYAPRR